MLTALFGCIADDFTGATDMGSLLARAGLRVALIIGVPTDAVFPDDVDAIIIALKNRTIEPNIAVEQSLAAARWLKAAGAETLYFKYCSTFDSTDRGNIGPVADALGRLWGEERILFNPAFPQNGRTVYNGYLFVGGRLISETGMASHPLTPMRDADLVRVLGRQVDGAPVGLVDHATLATGVEAVAREIARGPRFQISDSICDADLTTLAQGAMAHAFATGGSAFGAAYALARRGGGAANTKAFPRPDGAKPVVILAGSCSEATLRQLAAVPSAVPHVRIAANRDAISPPRMADVKAALKDHKIAVVSSSADPETLAVVQAKFGRDAAGAMVERAFADIAAELFDAGQRIFIVAGGETSGAVVERLGVTQLLIGPEIAPGVPWCYSALGGGLWLALKSGNFGGEHFFDDARRVLMETSDEP